MCRPYLSSLWRKILCHMLTLLATFELVGGLWWCGSPPKSSPSSKLPWNLPLLACRPALPLHTSPTRTTLSFHITISSCTSAILLLFLTSNLAHLKSGFTLYLCPLQQSRYMYPLTLERISPHKVFLFVCLLFLFFGFCHIFFFFFFLAFLDPTNWFVGPSNWNVKLFAKIMDLLLGDPISKQWTRNLKKWKENHWEQSPSLPLWFFPLHI